jgi:predicted DNA-binding transcriptional regulator YafY
MYNKQSKKMVIFNILEILKNYSDADHRLTQLDIINYLKKDYDMIVDRKTVLRNVNELIEEGIDIDFDENDRGKGKNKNTIRTNFYIHGNFEDSELRLLIDGLLFSKYIPHRQCKELITKIENEGNRHFKSRVRHIVLPEESVSVNKELFYNIDVIDEAINKNLKIEFNYLSYGIDKKPYIRKDEGGNERIYRVSCVQMVATNNHYYLVCTDGKHRGVANYRVDRIINIKLTKEKGTDKKEVEHLRSTFNLPKHMMEHLYMYGNESGNVAFEFDAKILNDVIDWFGNNIDFRDLKNGKIEAKTNVILDSMKFWALQYAEYVRVISPKSLVDDIKKVLKDSVKKYK